MSGQDLSGIIITITGDSNDSNLVISSTSGSIVENGATGPQGPSGETGPQGPTGPRGEAFQVDEFNVDLSDGKVTSIINTSTASSSDFYVFVVANDTRTSDISGISQSINLSRHVVAFNGLTFNDYGPFTGIAGPAGQDASTVVIGRIEASLNDLTLLVDASYALKSYVDASFALKSYVDASYALISLVDASFSTLKTNIDDSYALISLVDASFTNLKTKIDD